MVLSLKQKLTGAAIVAFLILAFSGFNLLNAASQADVGYVDVKLIVNDYLLPEISGPLQDQTDKLQAEFDSKSKDLSDEEKSDLFSQYQQKLDAKKAQLLSEQWPKIDEAVEAVAKAEGLRVVLDKQGVLYGGVDVTKEVLLKLGVKVTSQSNDTGADKADAGDN